MRGPADHRERPADRSQDAVVAASRGTRWASGRCGSPWRWRRSSSGDADDPPAVGQSGAGEPADFGEDLGGAIGFAPAFAMSSKPAGGFATSGESGRAAPAGTARRPGTGRAGRRTRRRSARRPGTRSFGTISRTDRPSARADRTASRAIPATLPQLMTPRTASASPSNSKRSRRCLSGSSFRSRFSFIRVWFSPLALGEPSLSCSIPAAR